MMATLRFTMAGETHGRALAAVVVLPGSDLAIRDVGLNPTRTAFLSALTEMGADIRREDERLEGGEPIGTLRTRGNALKESRTLEISATVIPNLIDELPLLAFLVASTGCRMEVGDARQLRVKESDRIAATVENLSRMGARDAVAVLLPEFWNLLEGVAE